MRYLNEIKTVVFFKSQSSRWYAFFQYSAQKFFLADLATMQPSILCQTGTCPSLFGRRFADTYTITNLSSSLSPTHQVLTGNVDELIRIDRHIKCEFCTYYRSQEPKAWMRHERICFAYTPGDLDLWLWRDRRLLSCCLCPHWQHLHTALCIYRMELTWSGRAKMNSM